MPSSRRSAKAGACWPGSDLHRRGQKAGPGRPARTTACIGPRLLRVAHARPDRRPAARRLHRPRVRHGQAVKVWPPEWRAEAPAPDGGARLPAAGITRWAAGSLAVARWKRHESALMVDTRRWRQATSRPAVPAVSARSGQCVAVAGHDGSSPDAQGFCRAAAASSSATASSSRRTRCSSASGRGPWWATRCSRSAFGRSGRLSAMRSARPGSWPRCIGGGTGSSPT